MSLNAAAIRILAEKGLTALDIAELAEAMEVRKDPTGAERAQRHRDKKKAESGAVTRDVTRDDVTPIRPLDKKSPQTPKELIPCESNISPACEAIDFPEGITADLWAQYRVMRKKIRKPLTPYAEKLALKNLRKFAEDGYPPGAIVEDAIIGSYQGLFPPKGPKNGNGNHHNNPGHEWGSTVAAANSLLADMERAERDGG